MKDDWLHIDFDDGAMTWVPDQSAEEAREMIEQGIFTASMVTDRLIVLTFTHARPSVFVHRSLIDPNSWSMNV